MQMDTLIVILKIVKGTMLQPNMQSSIHQLILKVCSNFRWIAKKLKKVIRWQKGSGD